jgi:hypothetical protein
MPVVTTVAGKTLQVGLQRNMSQPTIHCQPQYASCCLDATMSFEIANEPQYSGYCFNANLSYPIVDQDPLEDISAVRQIAELHAEICNNFYFDPAISDQDLKEIYLRHKISCKRNKHENLSLMQIIEETLACE